ncbi:uncharacterized protein LTR77_002739 [Saxophila tyrrhenica]|uniref:YAG7-like dimerisation domain-containing protein n=1 Tax=Saxophila tyrrhenica TaxID=1690608 RepID=A0AAV9PFH5_9PEZI|nr:hypothetical protein LTR77_002739 [Saxophila tyrrhenica]
MDALPAQSRPAESKSAKKKRAKAEGGANGSVSLTAVPNMNSKEDSSVDAKADSDGSYEHPYIKELNKQIRNTHKKLGGMQKVDAVMAENPNTSLDDLVAQRKINNDQKASVLKKPQLQQQLAQLEEQISQYRKFAAEFQDQLSKQKEDLTSQHVKEVEKLREELSNEGKTVGLVELRSKLLTLSQFLRLAAAKRGVPEEAETQEGYAFEGALLGVYGGDEKAVDTALKLIDGADEQVPNVDGHPTTVKYSEIKQSAVVHAPYSAEENWVDSVAEATSAGAQPGETDPTIAHAGLNELDTSAQSNGVTPAGADEPLTSPPQAGAGDEAGNAAGDRWDTAVAGADAKGSNDGLEMVARPSDEVDVPNPSGLPADALQESSGNAWADEQPDYSDPPAGFVPGAGGAGTGEVAADDVKATMAAGEPQVDASWAAASEPAQPLAAGGWADGDAAAGAVPGQEEGDGFQSVPGRRGGRGGRGRGDGEFRGRGRGRGGFRGDGEFRGRGRGGFRGGRGEGEFRGRGRGMRGDGEFRGRGGRGREPAGPRGGAEGAALGAS